MKYGQMRRSSGMNPFISESILGSYPDDEGGRVALWEETEYLEHVPVVAMRILDDEKLPVTIVWEIVDLAPEGRLA